MPHDVKRNLLVVGDKVVIRGTIKAIYGGLDYCNCEVEIDAPMPPDMHKSSISSINTRQLEKVE